ncbi:NPY1 [Candida jiufengensis]|uniref:NPY1 n=1 Tax=Candida jiufengensis TaxID=497108 RepID=UPI0022247355|nr:NPY1 [Candida jiufengensis]KAI5956931.1 NPY1 [Candida jiufengensis]
MKYNHLLNSISLIKQSHKFFNKSFSMSHSLYSSIKEIQKDMYFGTEVLNRVSFLREDNEFISQSLFHPSTRFIFFNKQNPLVHKNYSNKITIITNGDNQINVESLEDLNGKRLGYKGNQQFISGGLINNIPNWETILTKWCNDNKNQSSTLRSDTNPVFLFLGLLDESIGLDINTLKSNCEQNGDEKYLDHQGRYQGIAYYAVDISRNKELCKNLVHYVNDTINQKESTTKTPEENGIFFTHSRKHFLNFNHYEASLFSQGAMFFHWLKTNKFCPGCGKPTIPIHAGGKLLCTNEETVEIPNPEDSNNPIIKSICPVKSAPVSNVSFPRTDMAIISIITNRDRSKILLSLGRRHVHSKMYSCTAGFMEPSETIEVATKREIWEETGVNCNEIQIVMTQPWPFPQNLMIGCIGIVEFNGENEIINLNHDNELLDARWFDTSFVRKLVYPSGIVGSEENGIEEHNKDDDDFNPEGIMIPMSESIAFSLIKLCVDEEKNNHHKL